MTNIGGHSLRGLLAVSGVSCAMTFHAVSAQAGQMQLEQVFDRCAAYATGARSSFEGLAEVEIDPTDAAVTYQRVATDAGLATVKLIRESDCWVYGASFDPNHRSTTIKWDEVRGRAKQWINDPKHGTAISRTEHDAGMNSVICKAGGKAHQNTATGGGTDDKDRALTFSSRVYEYSKCP